MPEMDLKVGDEIAYARWNNGVMITGGVSRVAKVNRWGHITLENGTVYNKNGTERCDGYYGKSLISVDRYNQFREQETIRRARSKAAQDIINAITEKRNGYGHIGTFSDEDKAQLKILIDML